MNGINIKIIFQPMPGKSKPVHASIRRTEQVLDPHFLSYRCGIDLHCDIISQNCNFYNTKILIGCHFSSSRKQAVYV